MDKIPAGKHGLGPLIFVLSCACLIFELSLLRTFSITLWYHFAFMVISIAMLGIGASGTALSILPRLRDLQRIPLYTTLFALSLPLSYAAANAVPFDPARLAWDTFQLLLIALYYLVLSVPFFLFGAVMSSALSFFSDRSGAIYASDLLGAGTGSLVVLLLLSLAGPELAVLAASLLAATGAFMVCRGRLRLFAAVLVVIIALLLITRPTFITPRMSTYKPLNIALSFPGSELTGTFYRPYGRIDTFRSPAVRFAPGLSIRYSGTLPDQTGVAVDGGSIEAITDDRDPAALAFLEHLPAALPYRLLDHADVLVLDPGGGLPVLMARRNGAYHIDAVESDPLLLEVVRRLSGRDREGEDRTSYHTGLGRSWLAATGRSFDVIDLPLTGVMGSSGFGFSEDYRFTVDAFTTYLLHLEPSGILSVTHYILPPPRAELRTVATLAEAAARIGLREITDHLIIIRSWDTVTVLFSRFPLKEDTVERARQFCRERRFDMVYYPGIGPGESNQYVRMPDDTYAEAFEQVIDHSTRGPFLNQYVFDVRPVGDGNPFSRYYLRLEHLAETFRVMGNKWQFFFEEGYLLPVLFLQVAGIALLLLVAPLVAVKLHATRPGTSSLPLWPWYFGFLGLAYLFVEVALIQTMQLPLEHPAYAAGTVVASLLISSGLGSMTMQRVPALRQRLVLLAVGITTLLSSALVAPLGSLLVHLTLFARMAVVFLFLMPVGFLMGIPFPLGMVLLGDRHGDRIPWAWAVNGCFSVLAPVLAVMIALAWGYQAVAGLGSALYMGAFLVMRRWDGRVSEGRTAVSRD